MGCEAQLMAW